MNDKQVKPQTFQEDVENALRVKGGVKNKESFINLAYAVAAEAERSVDRRFQELMSHVPEPWVDQLEDHLTEVLEERLGLAKERALKAPPARRTVEGSRKLVVPRKKLQGTCDSELFELFEKDRKARGLNTSQMLDFVLFNFYNHPNLDGAREKNAHCSEGSEHSTKNKNIHKIENTIGSSGTILGFNAVTAAMLDIESEQRQNSKKKWRS